MRAQIREALKNMGLIIDFVNSVEEAVVFCRDGLPHAIIVESIQRGEKFAQLREDDFLARYGGDEFLICLTQTQKPAQGTRNGRRRPAAAAALCLRGEA